MADDTMRGQKFQQRHFEQSRVKEQLSGRGPSAGITLEAFLDKLLQKQTRVTHFWTHEGAFQSHTRSFTQLELLNSS